MFEIFQNGTKNRQEIEETRKALENRKNGPKTDFELVYDVHFPLIKKLGKWIINIPPFIIPFQSSLQFFGVCFEHSPQTLKHLCLVYTNFLHFFC